jgi:hypothetical protein
LLWEVARQGRCQLHQETDRLCAFARDSVTREQAGFDQLAQRDPDPPGPIVDVKIENPYNLQDFQNDKLSILDEFWLSVRSVIVG